MQILSQQLPSIEQIVHELQKLKFRESEIANSLVSITFAELTKILEIPNSIFVIDSAIIEEN